MMRRKERGGMRGGKGRRAGGKGEGGRGKGEGGKRLRVVVEGSLGGGEGAGEVEGVAEEVKLVHLRPRPARARYNSHRHTGSHTSALLHTGLHGHFTGRIA